MNRLDFIKSMLFSIFSLGVVNLKAEEEAPPPPEEKTPEKPKLDDKLDYVYSLQYTFGVDVGQIRREKSFESLDEVRKKFKRSIVEEDENFVKIVRNFKFNTLSKSYIVYTNSRETINRIINERLI